jgi:uncharacterized caspase-like protein
MNTVKKLPSKILFFVDTCNSGNITGTISKAARDNRDALREFITPNSRVIVITASMETEPSREAPEWGNGAFTKALVEGLQDYGNNNKIEIRELGKYIRNRVKTLTDDKQHPMTKIPKIMPNFPIAVK